MTFFSSCLSATRFTPRTSWARGVVDFSHRSHNGEEIAEINWAPQFFLNPLTYDINNPGDGILKAKWTSALSGLRRNEIATRWMFDVPRTPAHVGVAYRYHRELEWIFPGDFVLQTMRRLDVRRLGYQANAGISLDFPDGKGLIATEGHFSRLARADYSNSKKGSGSSFRADQVQHAGLGGYRRIRGFVYAQRRNDCGSIPPADQT